MSTHSKRQYPFQNMTASSWQNLFLVATLAFYIVRSGAEFHSNGLASISGDFICFWTTGKVANEYGYAAVYDNAVLGNMQRSLVPDATAVLPMFYLPVFIFPFQALALVPILYSFWVWTLINLIVLGAYLYFFIKQIRASINKRFLLLILIAFPVFQNFYAGQVNLFLMIAVGEFIRAIIKGKQYRAGVMLAFLLLKPQSLILLLPMLLIQRNWKALIGFGAASSILLLGSFGMIGIKGVNNFIVSWRMESLSNPTIAPEIMMNWRMIGSRLSTITTPNFRWVVAFIGIIGTLWLVILLWRKSIPPASPEYLFVLFGTLAATNVISWHSHVHMAVILIPVLIYLFAQGFLHARIINLWSFLPVATLFIGLLCFVLISLLGRFVISPTLADFLLGLGLLSENLYFLFWCYRETSRLDRLVYSRQPIDAVV